MMDASEGDNGYLTVVPVLRDCPCGLAERGLCTWCCSLVVDCEGVRWVYHKALVDGGEPLRVLRHELSKPPVALRDRGHYVK